MERDLFRNWCCEKLTKFEHIVFPIENEHPYEATLIELSRKLPHIEYIIQNAIVKLSHSPFTFSIVCSEKNIDFMKQIQNKFPFLLIHKLPNEIASESRENYNDLLFNRLFWNFFQHRQSVLIMQEDTFIFKSNIEDFLQYDYIGAPWSYNSIMRKIDLRVGNGGFSLRKMSFIYEVLDHKEAILKKMKEYEFHSEIEKLEPYPEDIFFSFAAIYLGKNIPKFDVARSFATENIACSESFGGHQFWNADHNYQQRFL